MRCRCESSSCRRVHRLALQWSGVEPALIGEVRPKTSRCVVESRFRRLIDGPGFAGTALPHCGGPDFKAIPGWLTSSLGRGGFQNPLFRRNRKTQNATPP